MKWLKERIRAMPHSGRIKPPGKFKQMLFAWAKEPDVQAAQKVELKIIPSLSIRVFRACRGMPPENPKAWDVIGEVPVEYKRGQVGDSL